MKQNLFGRRALGVGACVALFAALPASAASAATPPAAATTCAEPAISQPFLSYKDSNWYTLAPGQTTDSFSGGEWTLTGGARIVSATLPSGVTTQVLDLPAGSTAVSPAMCVDGNYPTARMQARTLGKAPDNTTKFSVQAVGKGAATSSMPVLGTTSWGATPPVNVATAKSGAEQVTFTFKAGAKAADLQVYDLYIDPRMCH